MAEDILDILYRSQHDSEHEEAERMAALAPPMVFAKVALNGEMLAILRSISARLFVQHCNPHDDGEAFALARIIRIDMPMIRDGVHLGEKYRREATVLVSARVLHPGRSR